MKNMQYKMNIFFPFQAFASGFQEQSLKFIKIKII